MSEVYIAGKVDYRENTIVKLAKELEERGHKIAVKWWEGEKPPRPYLDYPENSKKAKNMIKKAFESEVFILITDDGILGAMAEFGAALVSEKKDIIVIINEDGGQSIFFTHSKVSVLRDVCLIRERSWY